MSMRTWLFGCLAASLALAPESWAAGPANFMIRAQVKGNVIEGRPLSWSDQSMLLLARDGVLHQFDPSEAKNAKKTSTTFVAYSSNEIQARLRAEFDARFRVTTTPHFVVAHPSGVGRAWADRLESLYRSFSRYVSVRGFAYRAPAIPLTAVVFRDQGEFLQYAQQSGKRLSRNVFGYYDLMSNRVFLFDTTSLGGDWKLNSDIIIHEAVHQIAYNIGVHSRLADQPQWVVEGLAMMFEARGVWDASSAHTQVDRINQERLTDFRARIEARDAGWLARLVHDDRTFRGDPLGAYCEAWALTFFLCETQPRQYCGFLNRTATRSPFAEYWANERVADFAQSFGSDFAQLEAHLQRFIDELP